MKTPIEGQNERQVRMFASLVMLATCESFEVFPGELVQRGKPFLVAKARQAVCEVLWRHVMDNRTVVNRRTVHAYEIVDSIPEGSFSISSPQIGWILNRDHTSYVGSRRDKKDCPQVDAIDALVMSRWPAVKEHGLFRGLP